MESPGLSLEQIMSVLAMLPNPVSLNRKCVDENGQPFDEIVYVNPEFEDSIGYSVEDIPTDRDWFAKAYPDSSYQQFIVDEWSKSLKQAQKLGKSMLGFPAEVQCKNGKKKWFQVTTQITSEILENYHVVVFVEIETPDQTVQHLQSLTQELVQNNHELQSSKDLLDEVQSIAQIGSWEINLTQQSISWSKEMFRIFLEDESTHTPTLDDFYSRLSPEDAALTSDKIEKTITTRKKQGVVIDARRGDGSKVTLEIYGHAVFDTSDQPVKIVGTTMDVTHRVRLQKENSELAQLIRVAQQELYIVSCETDKFVYVNESACQNTGYLEHELTELSVYDLNPEFSVEQVLQLKQTDLPIKSRLFNTSVHKRKDNSFYHVHSSIQPIKYNGQSCYAFFDVDISQLKAAEDALEDQLTLLQNIIDTVPVRIFWKDLEGRYLGANNLFLQDAQIESKDDIVGNTDYEMTWGPTDAEAYRADDLAVMKSGKPYLQFEEEQTNKDGKTIVLSTSKVPLKNSEGDVFGVLGSYQDVTEYRRAQADLIAHQSILHHQAHHDSLTNLPNRLLLQDRLTQTIKLAKRHKKPFGLLFIDLDNFKQINDAMGHDIGDQVLQEMALRFKNSIRDSDTLARLGGDEFTIIVEEVENERDISQLAHKIIELTQEPIQIQQQELYLSSSIGISLYPKDASSAEELLKYADAAMYRAKKFGRNNFQYYTEDLTQMAFEHVAMQASLRQAIKNDEFIIAFQPQVDADKQTLIGMEALVRWNHPVMGIVLPNLFIPLAEETGSIVELDRLVMRSAMQQWQQWRQSGLDVGVLSLNLSVKQIQTKDIISFLQETMSKTGCQPEWLCLEVTESDVMTNLDAMNAVLLEVQTLGIHVSIDDFGTGYSSLAYLKRLPVSKLKIDRSFIKDLPDDEEDSTITRTIIMMADNLGLEVIAEGVETEAQRDFLLQNGCSDIQGYYYSPPLFAKEVESWLLNFNTSQG